MFGDGQEVYELYLAYKEDTSVYLILSFDENTGHVSIKKEIDRKLDATFEEDNFVWNLLLNDNLSYNERILKLNKRG